MFNPDKYEHCEIFFNEMQVHLEDGKILPITNMLNKKGQKVEEYQEAVIIQAGEGDCWVNLRLLD